MRVRVRAQPRRTVSARAVHVLHHVVLTVNAHNVGDRKENALLRLLGALVEPALARDEEQLDALRDGEGVDHALVLAPVLVLQRHRAALRPVRSAGSAGVHTVTARVGGRASHDNWRAGARGGAAGRRTTKLEMT